MAADGRNRVLLIGLDGATWDLLDRWASQGLLPTIERLRSRGAWGPLRTVMPPITPACCNSIYTGTGPGKHGIFGFSQPRGKDYRLSPVHASARKAKTVFRILSDAGLKVGVLNAPATYPPEALNGLFAPGIPVPDKALDYTAPPELGAELDALTGGRHKYPPDEASGREEEVLSACDEYSNAVTSAAALMMERLGQWDFFMVYFQVTDTVQHMFWHCLDADHPRHDAGASETLQNAILDRYRTVDRCLDDILRRAGEDVDVLAISDHGFGPFDEQLYLNVWLWQQGWLKLKRNPQTLLRRLLYSLGLTPEFVRRHVYSRVPRSARKVVEARRYGALAIADRFFLSLDDVDWERTRAYSFQAAIYVNRQGREPQGCVSADEYDGVLESLEQDLLEMRHPLTGERLVERVLRSSDAFEGPFSSLGPDLQLLTSGFKYHGTGFLQFQSKRWIGPTWNRWSGYHNLDGILLASGPHVKRGVHVAGAHIVDIAPTILALLAQPIPHWMDGRAIAAALDDAFLEQHPPTVVHDADVPGSVGRGGGYSPEEEAEITKRLAGLGYIE